MTRVVCILGMHRSGTSCLAGSLQEAGLYLGDVSTVGRHNVKGNRENIRIRELHEAVLAHSGGSWVRPPGRVSWSDAHREERNSIIRSHGDVPAWGFKDPRTVLLLDFWRETLPDLVTVATLRHPHLVAQSLLDRDGGSVDGWMDLWAEYNERLLVLCQIHPTPIIRFDLGEDSYRRSVRLVMETLGLHPPEQMAFFDPDLRHHAMLPPGPLPERASRIYQALCGLAIER